MIIKGPLWFRHLFLTRLVTEPWKKTPLLYLLFKQRFPILVLREALCVLVDLHEALAWLVTISCLCLGTTTAILHHHFLGTLQVQVVKVVVYIESAGQH